MSIIEKIVGLVPTVRGHAKAVLDFVQSATGKIAVAALISIVVLACAHQLGVRSQQPKIAELQKQLADLAVLPIEKIEADHDQFKPKDISGWLADQARINEALQSKVTEYEKEVAKRPARSCDKLTPADARRLLSIK